MSTLKLLLTPPEKAGEAGNGKLEIPALGQDTPGQCPPAPQMPVWSVLPSEVLLQVPLP